MNGWSIEMQTMNGMIHPFIACTDSNPRAFSFIFCVYSIQRKTRCVYRNVGLLLAHFSVFFGLGPVARYAVQSRTWNLWRTRGLLCCSLCIVVQHICVYLFCKTTSLYNIPEDGTQHRVSTPFTKPAVC